MEVSGRPHYMSSNADTGTSCEPCDSEGETVTAVAFCKQCCEFLCQSCSNAHRRYKQSKHHDILEGNNMPTSHPTDKTSEHEDFVTCSIHAQTAEKVKYYCQTHDQVGCGDCIVKDHKGCEVDFITDLIDNFNVDNQIRDLQKELTSVCEEYSACSTNIKDILKSNALKSTEAIAEIKSCRSDIIKYVDKREVELLAEISNMKEEDESCLMELETKCQHENAKLSDIKQTMAAERKSPCILFATVKQTSSVLKKMKGAVSEMSIVCTANRRDVTFRREKMFTDLLHSQTPIGTLVFNGAEPSQKSADRLSSQKSTGTVVDIGAFPSQKTAEDMKKARFDKTGSIIIDVPSIGSFQKISSIILYSPNILLVVDYQVKIVAAVDTSTNQIISHHKLPSDPWDIANITDNKLAVTLFNEGKIQIMSFQNNVLSQQRDFKVNGTCRGVDFDSALNQLAVTFEKPPKVELMDIHGRVQKVISNDDLGQGMFTQPCYALFSNNNKGQGRCIYISDHGKHTLNKLSLEGKLLAKFKSETMRHPMQMVALGNGSILIGSWSSRNVHIMLEDGNQLDEILTEKDGLQNTRAICLSEDQSLLYVTSGDSGVVESYKITYT